MVDPQGEYYYLQSSVLVLCSGSKPPGELFHIFHQLSYDTEATYDYV